MKVEQQWQFDDAELPEWAKGAGRSRESNGSAWRAVPAPRPYMPVVLLGRLFIWRLALATWFFGSLYVGLIFARKGYIAEYAALAGFMGLCYGIHWIIEAFQIIAAQHAEARVFSKSPPLYSIRILTPFALVVLFPAAVLTAAAIPYLFANRNLSVLVLAIACLAINWSIGPKVLRFSRQRMLANHLVDPSMYDLYAESGLKPNLTPLFISLVIAFAVPTISSVSLGIAILTAFLLVYLAVELRNLSNFGSWRLVAGGLDTRARFTVYDYCDYEPYEEGHWRPSSERRTRKLGIMALSLSLDWTLLVALACLFPWELCATFSVPGYEFPQSALMHHTTDNLQWFLIPIDLAKKAQSPVVYLSGALMAFPLFILIPPAVLLATYIRPLIDLERVSQQLRRIEE